MPSRSLRLPEKAAGCLAAATAAVVWGSNGVIVNLIPLNASVIAFFRVFFASLFLAPFIFSLRRGEFLAAARRLKLVMLNGLLLCLGWVFLFASMKLIPIADAVLLNYLAPIFTAALAPALLKERLEKLTVLALALSFLGVLLISYGGIVEGSISNLLGVVYGLLAGLSYAGLILVSKKLRGGFSSLTIAFYSYFFAALFLTPVLLSNIPSLEPASWILLLILGGVNTSLAVTLYFYGLGLIKAQEAVVFTYLEPLSAAIFGLIFLDQVMGGLAIIGGALIVFSGYLVARS